jgi:hypothetical protein
MLTAVLIISGVWLVGTSLLMNTSNIKSAVFFKVIPFFLGLWLLLTAYSILQ